MGNLAVAGKINTNSSRQLIGILVVLVVLAGVLAVVILWLRGELRQRILNRDLAAFQPIVSSTLRVGEEQYLLNDALLEELGDPLLEFDSRIPAHLTEALLGTLGMGRVDKLVLFDREGFLQNAFPDNPGVDVLDEGVLKSLRNGSPTGVLTPTALELTLPLTLDDSEGEDFLGVARYYLSPTALQSELDELDGQLWVTGGILLFFGGGVVVWILVLSFRRLEKANLLLVERSQRLADANRKLLLAAKTSAVGSLTANLMHGLKNPLAGLQEFVRGLKESSTTQDSEEVQLAMDSARRMQDLIQETLAVIGDSEGGIALNYTLGELASILKNKLNPLADLHGVALSIEKFPSEELDSIRGNLLVLALVNLAQNSVEASASSQEVAITCKRVEEMLLFRVVDQAGGLPAQMKEDPFRPVRSSKPDGSGIGLALSYQLARQMDGSLELESTAASGTIFCISIPVS